MATDRTTPEFKEKRAAYFRRWYNRQVWPKCDKCECIARQFPDIGCLECYARTLPSRYWTADEKDIVEQFAGKDDLPHLQYRIYQDTGNARGRTGIKKQLRRMGIDSRIHQDGYTIPQIVEITGAYYSKIQHYITSQGIRNHGNGKVILLSVEDGEKLIARYTQSDKPAYSVKEACDVIGLTPTAIKWGIKCGLPVWRNGRSVRVCKATIDRIAQYLRNTGDVRVPWRSLVTR